MVWAELNFFLRSSDICHRNYCTNICNSVFSSFEVQFCHEGGLSGGRYFTRKGLFVHHPKLCLLLKPPSMYLFERFPKVLTNFFFEIIFDLMRGGGPKKEQKLVVCYITFLCFETPKASPILPQNHFAFFTSLLRNNQQFIQVYSETGNNESNSERLLNVH